MHVTQRIAISFVAILTCSSSFARPVLNIGFDEWPPFRMLEKGNPQGIDHRLWLALSQRLGFSINYVLCPWKRCLKMMEHGHLDAMSGLAWRQKRAEYISYTSSYYRCRIRFYVPNGAQHTITRHEDLSKQTIGMVLGSAYYPQFDQDQSLNKSKTTQEAVLPSLLLKGRIDSYIGTDCQADYELKARNLLTKISKAEFLPGSVAELHLGLSKKSIWSQKEAAFSHVIRELIAEGIND